MKLIVSIGDMNKSFVLAICFSLLALPWAVKPTHAVDGGHWSDSHTSEDGSTIVKTTFIDAPASLADVGFFGPDGKERAVIARRHEVLGLALSVDGYTAVWGGVVLRDGWFYTLYDPKGRLLWEMSVPTGDFAAGAIVSQKGHRTLVVYRTPGTSPLDASPGDVVLAVDEKGSITRRITLEKSLGVTWFGLIDNERRVMVTTQADARTFASEDMRLLWCAKKPDIGQIGGVAVSSDGKKIALLGRILGGPITNWRVILLDAANGRKLGHQDMQLGLALHDPRHPIQYDALASSFVVATKSGKQRVDADPSGIAPGQVTGGSEK